jgi:hypothetical protein
MAKAVYSENDNLIKIFGLQDEADGSAISSGTVSAQLYDPDGATVGSPVTMAHVSDGDWQGTLPASDLGLSAAPLDLGYRCLISVSAGGRTARFTLECEVMLRRA